MSGRPKPRTLVDTDDSLRARALHTMVTEPEDGPQSGSCCPFVETENEIHVEEWCEPAWLGARRIVAQSGCRDTDGLGELECDGASAYGNGGLTEKWKAKRCQ